MGAWLPRHFAAERIATLARDLAAFFATTGLVVPS